MEIKQQAVIISGGASGLGAATARHLAKLGAKVALLDINEAAAQSLAAELGGIGLKCDVSDVAQVDAAFAQAVAKLGPIRISVNCAGIAPGKRLVGREGPMPATDFEKVIQINLLGSFYMLRAAASHMTQLEAMGSDASRGVIINTASIAAFEGQIGQVAYSASKGGVVGMMLPAARELAQFGVRVMTIAPGIFATPMLQGMPQAVQDSLGAQVPFPKRLGQPSEYALLVQQIIENEMLNGSVIRLDGAIRMQAK